MTDKRKIIRPQNIRSKLMRIKGELKLTTADMTREEIKYAAARMRLQIAMTAIEDAIGLVK